MIFCIKGIQPPPQPKSQTDQWYSRCKLGKISLSGADITESGQSLRLHSTLNFYHFIISFRQEAEVQVLREVVRHQLRCE